MVINKLNLVVAILFTDSKICRLLPVFVFFSNFYWLHCFFFLSLFQQLGVFAVNALSGKPNKLNAVQLEAYLGNVEVMK